MYILWITHCAVTELNNPATTCLATGTPNRLAHVLYSLIEARSRRDQSNTSIGMPSRVSPIKRVYK